MKPFQFRSLTALALVLGLTACADIVRETPRPAPRSDSSESAPDTDSSAAASFEKIEGYWQPVDAADGLEAFVVIQETGSLSAAIPSPMLNLPDEIGVIEAADGKYTLTPHAHPNVIENGEQKTLLSLDIPETVTLQFNEDQTEFTFIGENTLAKTYRKVDKAVFEAAQEQHAPVTMKELK